MFFTQRHFSELTFLKILVHLSTVKKQHRNYILQKIILRQKSKGWVVNILFWGYSSKNSNIIKGFLIYLCGLWLKMCVEERLAIAVKAEDRQFRHLSSFCFNIFVFFFFFSACHYSPPVLSLFSVTLFSH